MFGWIFVQKHWGIVGRHLVPFIPSVDLCSNTGQRQLNVCVQRVTSPYGIMVVLRDMLYGHEKSPKSVVIETTVQLCVHTQQQCDTILADNFCSKHFESASVTCTTVPHS